MARTTATNFTGGLQFPMANAAADIFKKEDVQTLALAVDGHDHSTGKGAPHPAGSINGSALADGSITLAKLAANSIDSSKIVDGSITSADIADGTISTRDLAANAVSVVSAVQGSVANPSTTSTSYVAIPDQSLTLTTGGPDAVTSSVLVEFEGMFAVTPPTTYFTIGISVDGSPLVIRQANFQTTAVLAPVVARVRVDLPAGSHTFAAVWSTGASSTLSASSTQRSLTVQENRR